MVGRRKGDAMSSRMRRFDGRSAIVTGASRGIGAAAARRLAAEGADIVITARTLDHHPTLPGSLRETADDLKRFGGQVHVISADLSDPADRSTIVPQATELLGRPGRHPRQQRRGRHLPAAHRFPAQAQDADLRDQRARTHGPGAGGPARDDRTWRGLDRQRVECHCPPVGATVHPGLARRHDRHLRGIQGRAQPDDQRARCRMCKHRGPHQHRRTAFGGAERGSGVPRGCHAHCGPDRVHGGDGGGPDGALCVPCRSHGPVAREPRPDRRTRDRSPRPRGTSARTTPEGRWSRR